MRDNKFKLMELFLYIIIVVVGLVLLMFGKAGPGADGGTEPPPVEQTITAEGGGPVASLYDE